MPGFFNSLRSPSSPDLFQRFFSTRPNPPPEKSELSPRHARILKDCIAKTSKKIFKLERRIKSLNANILTICRCIENNQPSFSPPVVVRLVDTFQTEAVPSPPRKESPRRWSSIRLLRSHSPPYESKERDPASLIERPFNIPESEREIAAPTSMTSKDIALMVDRKADLQVQLNLLKLETGLLFWGGVYEQAKVAYTKELKQRKRKSCYRTKRALRPSLLRIESSSSDSTCSEHTEGSYTDTSATFKIPRKEVPIKEMIARCQTTSIFLSRLARSRGSSWSEGTDSSANPGSTNHASQDLTRDDSQSI
ncbi:hypothetical protein N431DRAFT_494570 [Stipitochalara longipes BDJ]|nr:hypothetical protein N431DRAFT_494570 [Stipitochalara longipes BDJ]